MTPPAAAAAPAVRPRRTGTPGRPLTAPARPRRVSGPARPATRARPVRPPSREDRGIALGVLGALNGVASHRLLDRLIRGRISIALVAFALIGIVTLQLGLLELNASIGRTLEREGVLQRENAALSIENSELAAGDRVEARAAQLGMRIVPVGALRFLAASPRSDVSGATAALAKPVQAPSGESRETAAAASGASTAGAGEPAASAEHTTGATQAASASGEAPSAPAGEATHASTEASTKTSEASTPAVSGTSPSREAPPAPAAAPAPATAQGSAPAQASVGGGTQAGSSG